MTLTTVDSDLGRRIDELESKLDRITELLEADRVSKAVVGDLMSESAPIVRAAYERLAATLHERDIDITELGDLILRFAEAAPDLNRALATFRSATDLVDDVGGLSGEAFELLTRLLDELDRRGYFAFAKGGFEIVNRIVTSFDEHDIQALGDNIVLIFEVVKEMTQPDVMQMLQRSARMVRADAEIEPQKLSMFRLFREMRDPDVKLGIHRMLTMLRGMAMTEGPAAETHEGALSDRPAKEER